MCRHSSKERLKIAQKKVSDMRTPINITRHQTGAFTIFYRLLLIYMQVLVVCTKVLFHENRLNPPLAAFLFKCRSYTREKIANRNQT